MGVSNRTIGTTGTGELTLGEFPIFCMWTLGRRIAKVWNTMRRRAGAM